MMFPSAVNGQMPFVDSYKQEQIKKVLEKHERARHHSGPDSHHSTEKLDKRRNTHSMPILWQSVYAGQRPRFISMPTLEDERLRSHSSHSTRHLPQQKSSDNAKSHKHSVLSSLKKLFSSKKDNSSSSYRSTGAIVQGDQSRPYSSRSKNKKEVSSDAVVSSGGRSPKRQRMRTISNLSGVMETIEEVNEVLLSTDRLSDSDSCSSSSSELTYRTVTSAPELHSSTSLLYSCGNLSSFSDSSSSHHGSGSDFICVI